MYIVKCNNTYGDFYRASRDYFEYSSECDKGRGLICSSFVQEVLGRLPPRILVKVSKTFRKNAIKCKIEGDEFIISGNFYGPLLSIVSSFFKTNGIKTFFLSIEEIE